MLFLERVLKRGKNVEVGPMRSCGSSNAVDKLRMSFRFGSNAPSITDYDIVCDNEGGLLFVRNIAMQAVAFVPGVFANYGKTAERLQKREAAKWLVRLAEQLIEESNV